jgi:GNAT superfamily N-acetyltransferase
MRLKEFAPSPGYGGNGDDDYIPPYLVHFANIWWNATDPEVQKYIEDQMASGGWSIAQVESEDDAVQLQHRDGTTYFISADDFDPNLREDIEQLPKLINKTANVDGIQVSINTNEKNASVYASSHGRRLGYAEFDREGNVLVPYDLAVSDEYRGQGIAAVMYDYVKSLGFTIKASTEQTDAGKYFWKKNRGDTRVWETELAEIARIPQGDFGDEETITQPTYKIKKKPLPGGAGYTYAVSKNDPEVMEIMIFDGDTLAAEMDVFATLDPLKTWRVETVATAPAYRGKGLGKALYGIALTILKLTLEAGETQTKHGQAMWIKLNSIPGVEVLGYAMTPTDTYRAKPGDHVVDQNERWTRFTFPVEPGKRSMRSTRPGTGIYSSQYVSMIARWTGR